MVNSKYKAIGVMSGTSLDGVDVVACEFYKNGEAWTYKIIEGKTFDYPEYIYELLKASQKLSAIELAQLDVYYGRFLGETVKSFLADLDFKPGFIASHGYTVFHQPDNGLTLQIGSGAEIAAITSVKTICNFRVSDVALGGQGAPLVPVGDELLFNEYVACLNLGGFSNISFKNEKNSRVAFDICPANFVLNHFAKKQNLPFDYAGELGRQGNIDSELLQHLNNLPYYAQVAPKSLGREFVEQEVYPLIPDNISDIDALATFYEHINTQLSSVISNLPQGKVLVTGGGALNNLLIEKLKESCSQEIVVSDRQLIDFKEALIFGFLGVLRVLEISNCLAAVTGASRDNVGGVIYL